MTPSVRRAFGCIADLLWPRTCAVESCGRPCDRPGRHICSRCFATLPFLEAGGECSLCGLPVPAETRHEFVCETCRESRPAFERARGALRYAGQAEDLVKAFKYGGALQLQEDFADLMEATLRAKFECSAVDVVMPVPMHPHRRMERGFNQSELLAKSLADRIGRRLDTRSLAKKRHTPQQAGCNAAERRANLHAAFAVKRPGYVRGRTILLVDDVMTTGSTLSECARKLSGAGAARIWCITLARAVRD